MNLNRNCRLKTELSGLPTSFIKLNPPLPFTAMDLGHGFVTAMSAERVIVDFAEQLKPTNINNKSRLTISLTDGQTYHYPSVSFSHSRHGAFCEGLVSNDKELKNTQPMGELINHVRKDQHISICAHEDVEASDRYTGFSDITLKPRSFPEMSWDDLDISRSFLGRNFSAPLLITGMTGGLSRGTEINRRLALAAAEHNIPMGVGSQRIAIENPELEKIFAVKNTSPNVFLIGNLGLSQLGGDRSFDSAKDMLMRAIEMIDADAMAFHINVLQELIQVEGDRDFKGLIDLIARLVDASPVPIMVKEVGAGIDGHSAKLLKQAGISAIDVGGKGGTSWSYIEGQRAASEETKALANTFRDFGVPTAFALSIARSELNDLPLVATGGIRDGLTAAKAVGLGADMVGIGLPLLHAALESENGAVNKVGEYIRGIKTAMMCSAAKDLNDISDRLRKNRVFSENIETFI
jgi:isopentenyl-diphosphate Delta-isomerase